MSYPKPATFDVPDRAEGYSEHDPLLRELGFDPTFETVIWMVSRNGKMLGHVHKLFRQEAWRAHWFDLEPAYFFGPNGRSAAFKFIQNQSA